MRATPSLVVSGGGSVVLNNANTFTGPITVSNGSLSALAASIRLRPVVASGATLNVSGVAVSGVALTNNGVLNAGSVAQTVNQTVGSIAGSGTTSVSNGTLTIFNSASQSAINVNAGGKLALTSPNYQLGTTAANAVTTGSLNIAQNAGAWSGTVNLGSATMLVAGGNAATIYSQIQQASAVLGGNLTWTGNGGITSSVAVPTRRRIPARTRLPSATTIPAPASRSLSPCRATCSSPAP